MGCPVGIGPEIILKSYRDSNSFAARAVIFGDIHVLQKCAAAMGLEVKFIPWLPGERCGKEAIYVCQVPETDNGVDLSRHKLVWGKPDTTTGQAMASYIIRAVAAVQQGQVAALVTCPITKTALNAAGYKYPGHTEMLADLCHSTEYAMMMAGKSLRVTLVTIHQALSEVAKHLSVDAVCRLIDLTARSLQTDFGIASPRIAVAGFNPHAGEDGLFGDEEQRVIGPAVTRSSDMWNVKGPFPPDTVFNHAVSGKFDAVVCMYHDQGLIPFKLLHFADGVNVTIGLPIVRTSVDHGTAYDIAGKGVASPESLLAAFQMAAEIANNRLKILL
nr:4-hydroxythreonine-4-phosphate dehydrogenase PdxA [Desulfobulbaceae bacterium]